MKLKFSSSSSAAPADDTAPQTPSGGAPKLKLKFGGDRPPAETPPATAPAAGSSEQPKKKRQYTKKPKATESESATPKKASKKRPRADDDGDGATPKSAAGAKKKKKTTASKPAASASTQPALKLDTKNSQQKKPLKLSLKSAGPTPTPRLKVKHQGLPPPRPHGVGYDSGAEDAEVDPAIEHQFILRMIPGDDCDYLRKAIEEKKVGLSKKEGGADVMMRFFDREGRRAMISIRGRHYAACLVDLPCIVEGMKSWDRRGWWKSADICQMLLVFQQVKNEEEAKAVPLPKEVDDTTWAYPHGLTPPTHWVRKRRFRKRVSYRTIEAVEKEVEQLLADDEAAREKGGTSEYALVDLARLRQESDEAHAAEDGMEDAEGEEFYDDNGVPIGEPTDAFGEEIEEGEDDLARLLEAEFEDDAGQGPETAAEALMTANQAGGQGETPSSGAVGTEESSDEDDDDDDMDDDARMKQQERQQISEEVAELEKELANAKKQLQEQKNPLLRNRAQSNYDSILRNITLKRKALGEDPDE